MARTFNGTTDVWVGGAGTISANGAHSSLCLHYPTTLGSSTDKALWAAQAGAEIVAGMFTPLSNALGATGVDLGSDSNGDCEANMGITATTWQWLGHSKASGTVAATLHRNVIGSTTWTHTTASGTFANDASAITSITVGAMTSAAATPKDVTVAVWAWWNRNVTSAEIEWASLSLTHLLSTNPTAVIVFDQSATGMKAPDLTGNGSNESSKTGTSVATVSVPDFSYGAPIAIPTFSASSGSQTITPGFLASTEQLFAPTLAPGSVTITPGTISSGSQLFAPTLAPTFTLTPARIASTEQVFAPTFAPGSVIVTPGRIESAEQVFAPSLGGGVAIQPGNIASGEQVFTPTFAVGAVTVTAGFLASGAQVFTPGLAGGDVAASPPRVPSIPTVPTIPTMNR